jgi:hypothetical protein
MAATVRRGHTQDPMYPPKIRNEEDAVQAADQIRCGPGADAQEIACDTAPEKVENY